MSQDFKIYIYNENLIIVVCKFSYSDVFLHELELILQENNVNCISNETEESVIHLLCKSTNYESLKYALSLGPDLSVKNADGESALTWAVKQDEVIVAKILIEAGADLDEKK